jgi:aminoglycoside phosphotransferase (APT) family kinase protein
MCDELAAGLSSLVPALPAGVIHGDAWQGNLLVDEGVPVLSDLDQVSVGPREWDLVPTIVNIRRFGYPPNRRGAFSGPTASTSRRGVAFPCSAGPGSSSCCRCGTSAVQLASHCPGIRPPR